MELSADQKKAVSQWIAAGDNLSAVQQKLTAQFKISMTYMDVRFLVDDLNLQLKEAAPPPAPKPAPAAAPAAQPQAEGEAEELEEVAPEDLEDSIPADAAPEPASSVSVVVDKLVLIPGAMASGTVTFSDGVSGKWMIDQYGRPGFTEISKPGYRPTPTDAQAFMTKLSAAIQRQGY